MRPTKKNQQGFTLIELIIVVAVITILALAAVPNMLSARLASHQGSAVAAMRNLVNSQAQFLSTAHMDEDRDGAGEFGSLGELSGIAPLLRNGVGSPLPLDPAILSPSFTDIDANGVARHSGYLFRCFLPDAAGVGWSEGLQGAPNPNWDPNACEAVWIAYAWPVDSRTTGNRAYFTSYRGEILQTAMENTNYSGSAGGPAFNAAMTGPLMTDPPPTGGNAGNDGNNWKPVQ